MKIHMILTIVAGLLAGAICGSLIGFIIYAPQINNYKSQVDSLTQTVSNHEQQVSTLHSEISGLQEDLDKSQTEVMQYEEQVITLNSQISGLSERLENVLDITVTQQYKWAYESKTQRWDLQIPLSIYVEYLERPRPTLGDAYVDMAKDPNDDLYIDNIIQRINSEALEDNLDEFQKLYFTMAFIQSLSYTDDTETTPYDEYPRYPVETLFNRGGDCEDTSILAAALLDRMGYDVAILWLADAEHMAVGVSLPDMSGIYYEYGNKDYFYLETTVTGWKPGTVPPDYTDTEAYVYPLSDY